MLSLVKKRKRLGKEVTLNSFSLPFVTRLAEGSKSPQGLVEGVTVVAVGGNLTYTKIVNQSFQDRNFVHFINYLVGRGVGTVVSVVGSAEVDGTKDGKLQLTALSMKNLSHPLISQSCR